MYLSRVEIDTHNRQKMKDLATLSAYHSWVENSFPRESDSAPRKRNLWRIDRLKGKTYLLVLSIEKPMPDQLSRYGVARTVITKSYDNFLDAIEDGQQFRFRVTANPTHSRVNHAKGHGTIYPWIKTTDKKDWLLQQATKNGFKILSQQSDDDQDIGNQDAFDIVAEDRPLLSRRSGRSIRLYRTTFEGCLVVKDVTLFKQLLKKGLGREKAFGMGLLTVIPLKRTD